MYMSAGYYAGSRGATGALYNRNSCTAGYYCPQGSMEEFVCPPGHYCEANASIPTPCPAGYYNQEYYGENSSTSYCIDCPVGYYCPLGTTNPTKCPAGHVCALNSENYSTTCGAGKYTGGESIGSSGDCRDCPAGHYCEDGSAFPTPCPAGKFRTGTAG